VRADHVMSVDFRLPPTSWCGVFAREKWQDDKWQGAGRRYGFLSAWANGLMTVSACLLGLAVATETPVNVRYPVENTVRPASKRPLVLLAADGQPFARRGDCIAAPVALTELPRHLIDAALSMEDRRFYRHLGVDPLGILRAARRNYETGSHREGGSTITQQLVKMSYLSSAKTLERKAEEAMIATWLETRLTKDQILERYLSSAYFGEGCFGVRAAAQHLFNKPVGELTIAESALLVALLRAPTQLANNFEDANQRAKLVMQAMVRNGRLDEARLAEIQPAVLDAARGEELGSYYADWLSELVHKDVQDPHSRQPLTVYSTFEPGLQSAAEEAVLSVLDKQGRRAKAGQGALVAMRTDGRVVAMVGGRERAASQFNRAVQARRQPGSSFKTFVYLAALQAGIRPDLVLDDESVSVDGWEPKNFDGRFKGSVPLTTAFASSINTVAVKLAEAVGRDTVIRTARNLGISSPLAPIPSLALGTSEVSLLEMTAAYAAIAAGAYPVKPWGVAGLDALPGKGGEPPSDAGVWKLREAEEMRELLSGVVNRGSGRAADLSIPTYGKTGTSQEHRDAWFIGFAGNLVVGVWVGNDDSGPMNGVTGGSLPAQIWRSFMRAAMKSDARFERKLPRIAVFEARSRTPVDRSPMLASVKALVLPVEEKRRTVVRSRTVASGDFLPLTGFAPVERAPQPSSRPSREFQSRLTDMGWPGE
jgi:penicillin-binding protein 1A